MIKVICIPQKQYLYFAKNNNTIKYIIMQSGQNNTSNINVLHLYFGRRYIMSLIVKQNMLLSASSLSILYINIKYKNKPFFLHVYCSK